MKHEALSTSHAAAMRDAFDRSFAEAAGRESQEPPAGGFAASHDPAKSPAGSEDFLAVRVGGDPYALRLSEIGAIHRDRKVVPVESPIAEFSGLASFRGGMAPVYDLGALLGYSAGGPRRWLVLSRPPRLLGFAFDAVEGHLRASRDGISLPQHDERARHVRGAVRVGAVLYPLVHIASLIEAIERLVHSDNRPKEH
jgi:chemotaxis signal transduction protein